MHHRMRIILREEILENLFENGRANKEEYSTMIISFFPRLNLYFFGDAEAPHSILSSDVPGISECVDRAHAQVFSSDRNDCAVIQETIL